MMLKEVWEVLRHAKLRPDNEVRSIYNPFEQRMFGAVKVIEGLLVIVFGARAPGLTLGLAMLGAQRNHKRAVEDGVSTNEA